MIDCKMAFSMNSHLYRIAEPNYMFNKDIFPPPKNWNILLQNSYPQGNITLYTNR